MNYYETLTERLEAELKAARGALARDVAVAVSKKHWPLRDKYDVAAIVTRIDESLHDAQFLQEVRAAADRARDARGRGRGRPKKAERIVAKPAVVKPPARNETATEE